MRLGAARVRTLPWVLLWAIALVQVVTLHDNAEFVLFESGTAEHYGLIAAFVMTSAAWIDTRWRRPLVSAHLLVVIALIVRHPMGVVLERDGFLILFLAYFLTVACHLTSASPQLKFLAGSIVVAVALAETALSVSNRAPEWASLPDYGDVLGDEKPGGFLKPNLDLTVIGEGGGVRFMTNSLGFRNRAEVGGPPADDTRRVIFVGDSFVAGYRTDQEDTLGQRLQYSLTSEIGANVEVWLAGAGHPEAYLRYVREHAFTFVPDLVIVGITIGNDVASAYAVARRVSLEEGELADTYLPEEAYRRRWREQLSLRAHRSLHAWRIHKLLVAWLRPEGIGSWFHDVPGRVHMFDGIHALGLFFAREPIPQVARAWDTLAGYLKAIRDECRLHGTPCVFTVFPQRFQVNEREWRAVMFDFALDASAFDRALPNEVLAAICDDLNVECLDLLPGFQDARGSYYLLNGDMHWNAEGHRLAAELLSRELRFRRLITGP